MKATPTTASVVIVTKNRRDELRVAIRSALAQTVAVEVLVVDDGSTDGTSGMVREEFPQARLVRHDASRGYVVGRNEAAQLATGEIVFSIDDDAAFVFETTVAQTLAEFDDQRIGAVAIPYIEPNKQNQVFQRAPDASATWVTDTFIGTAHAVRRDLFLQLGGYLDGLVHQGEERDYCLRMLAAGRVVRLGLAAPIDHYESPKREWARVDFYGRRNDIVFAWRHVPMPLLPLHLAGTTVNGLRSALYVRHRGKAVLGILRGYADAFGGQFERRPVAPTVYRLHRRLKTAGPVTLDDVLPYLPAPAVAS
jgi:GT2 family glycosyltransferase